jgi:hypothetical protein
MHAKKNIFIILVFYVMHIYKKNSKWRQPILLFQNLSIIIYNIMHIFNIV